MSEIQIDDLPIFKKKQKAEFVLPDRAREIMERKPNATIDEVITNHG